MIYQEPTKTVTAVTYTPSPALEPQIRGLHFLSNKAMDGDEMRPTHSVLKRTEHRQSIIK